MSECLRRADEAERSIAEILASSGRKTKRMGSNSPFDILCDGRKIEVKTARSRMINRKSRTPSHRFNIHRHNILRERCEFYILRLEKAIGEAAVYILMPAPIRRKTFAISKLSLERGEWNKNIEDFHRLCAGKWREIRGSHASHS